MLLAVWYSGDRTVQALLVLLAVWYSGDRTVPGTGNFDRTNIGIENLSHSVNFFVQNKASFYQNVRSCFGVEGNVLFSGLIDVESAIVMVKSFVR